MWISKALRFVCAILSNLLSRWHPPLPPLLRPVLDIPYPPLPNRHVFPLTPYLAFSTSPALLYHPYLVFCASPGLHYITCLHHFLPYLLLHLVSLPPHLPIIPSTTALLSALPHHAVLEKCNRWEHYFSVIVIFIYYLIELHTFVIDLAR